MGRAVRQHQFNMHAVASPNQMHATAIGGTVSRLNLAVIKAPPQSIAMNSTRDIKPCSKGWEIVVGSWRARQVLWIPSVSFAIGCDLYQKPTQA